MATPEDALEQMANGLDRAPLHDYNTPGVESASKNLETDLSDTNNGEHSSPLDNIRRLSKKFKSKLHRTTLVETVNNDQRRLDTTALAPTLAPPPSTDTKDERFTESPPQKPTLPPAKEFLTSPLETAKSLAHIHGGNDVAENLAKTDVSHGASVQFVRAYDKVGEAETEADKTETLQDLAQLKKTRQDSFVRWTLDRHVSKVGRVHAHHVSWKERNDFVKEDETGRKKMHWTDYGRHRLLFYLEKHGGRYIGASSDLPDPNESALISSSERVLLTSTPLQNLFMKLRHISCWENESESAMYMAIYFVLLIFNLIPRAVLVLIIYVVLMRRFFPPTVEDMRQSLKESEDRERTAQDLSQLIEAHGAQGWIQPLTDKAGPTLLSNLDDMANVMEMARNFYEWRDPQRTTATLGVLVLVLVNITFTPLWLLVHETFFGMGFMFFVLIPISVRFPQYRLLTSPMIWLFWKIPTHAEWAIARVQVEATEKLEVMRKASKEEPDKKTKAVGDDPTPSTPSSNPEPSDPEEKPTEIEMTREPPVRIGRYHCKSEKSHGNLCVSTDRVSFEVHLTAEEKWSLGYEDMKSMEKIVGSGTLSSGDDLAFFDMGGNEFRASGLSVRDEVFSQIVGYSNVRWQRTG